MKKHIRIKFVDFWDDFVPENNLFYQLLSEHYDVELSDNPEYLFCSVFGDEHLRYDCVQIFYTGENQSADFNLYDYAIGFDRMEFGDRYFRLPIYYLNRYQKDFRLMQEKHKKPRKELQKWKPQNNKAKLKLMLKKRQKTKGNLRITPK